jgi:hypothetical protein
MPARFADPSQHGTPAGPWPEGPPTAHHDVTMLNGGHLPFTPHVPYSVWQRLHESNDLPSVIPQIVTGLAEAANAARVAAVLPESELRSELEASAAAFVEAVLGDYCGTRLPWPGPPARAIAIASALSELANTYQAGFLRDELLRIAGQAMEKAAGHHKP